MILGISLILATGCTYAFPLSCGCESCCVTPGEEQSVMNCGPLLHFPFGTSVSLLHYCCDFANVSVCANS